MRFVEETFTNVEEGERSSVVEATPPEERENLVEELNWKWRKSPLKVDEPRFAPRSVPFALPPKIGCALHWIRERVVVEMGTPLTMKAAEELVLFPVSEKTEVPVAVVKVSPEKVEVVYALPETSRRVVTVRFVPVAFVKVSPEKVEVVYLLPETSRRVVMVRFVPVALVKVMFARVEDPDHNCVVETPAVKN